MRAEIPHSCCEESVYSYRTSLASVRWRFLALVVNILRVVGRSSHQTTILRLFACLWGPHRAIGCPSNGFPFRWESVMDIQLSHKFQPVKIHINLIFPGKSAFHWLSTIATTTLAGGCIVNVKYWTCVKCFICNPPRLPYFLDFLHMKTEAFKSSKFLPKVHS